MDQKIAEERAKNYKQSLIRALNQILIEAEEARDYLEDQEDPDPTDLYIGMERLRENAYNADIRYQGWVALT